MSLSWMAKATVQAALGPIALKNLSPDDPDVRYGEILLMLCILSIVVTAPVGAILISITGTKLLTKTKNTHMPESKCCVLFILGDSIKIFYIILSFLMVYFFHTSA